MRQMRRGKFTYIIGSSKLGSTSSQARAFSDALDAALKESIAIKATSRASSTKNRAGVAQ